MQHRFTRTGSIMNSITWNDITWMNICYKPNDKDYVICCHVYHMKWYYLSYNSNSVSLTDLPYAFGFTWLLFNRNAPIWTQKEPLISQCSEWLRKRDIITLPSPINIYGPYIMAYDRPHLMLHLQSSLKRKIVSVRVVLLNKIGFSELSIIEFSIKTHEQSGSNRFLVPWSLSSKLI